MKKKATTTGRRGAAKPAKGQTPVYQFKITLLGIRPLIWRRIQVKECTLDKLHEHIQTTMGWTNSHLYHFKIAEQLYGDPKLTQENDLVYEDSMTTMLSQIIPSGRKRFRFAYQYDFGDSWEHEILFEGCPPSQAYRRYPVCLEGQRACPPEDVGGTGGYDEFLKAIADPDHEQHDQMVRWVGGEFNSEAFDPIAATKAKRKRISRLPSVVARHTKKK